MALPETETFYPHSKQQWRDWLAQNHIEKQAIWLITYRKNAGKPTISWSEAVDEALCFGWIDSVRKKLDEERSIQFFCKRKPRSTWSRVNKEKVAELTAGGLMTEAGLACVTIAKQNGSWELLDDVEALIVPEDLEAALNAKAGAVAVFLGLPKSAKKAMLHRLLFAKRPETRAKRILEIMAALKEQPGQE